MSHPQFDDAAVEMLFTSLPARTTNALEYIAFQVQGGGRGGGEVVCCMSHVTRHTSHVTRHTSHVTRHISPIDHPITRHRNVTRATLPHLLLCMKHQVCGLVAWGLGFRVEVLMYLIQLYDYDVFNTFI